MGRRGRSWPLQAYILLLVVVSAMAAGAGIVFERAQSIQDARQSAIDDAGFGAQQAAKGIGAGLALVRTTVDQAAANPKVEVVFTKPAGCTLTFGGAGGFTTGHLDIVRSDGEVMCTSLTSSSDVGYAKEPWFGRTLREPLVLGPLRDARTGRSTIVVATPVPGHGTVLAFMDLDGLGPGLADALAGRRNLEFLITSANGRMVLSRSIHAKEWTAKPLAGTAFAGSSGTERPDVDGTRRLYAGRIVSGVGWKVYAGASRHEALSDAMRLQRREIGILLLGLIGALGAALLLHRRLARPIQQLGTAVHDSAIRGEFEPVAVSGPREVTELAGEFNTMIETVNRELRERHEAEAKVRESESTYRLLFDANPEPMWVYDVETLEFLEVNDAAISHYGFSREEFLAMRVDDLQPRGLTPVDDRSAIPSDPDPWRSVRHRRKDGTVLDVVMESHAIPFDARSARLVVVQDVTERERLQRQVQQTQRLESLGQLAGGVAHDFNNLLGVILNYAAFVETKLADAASVVGGESWEPVRDDVEQIEKAARRATQLTHQLLAFARREVVQPIVLSLNDVVGEVEQLLRRSIGEHVRLETRLEPDLWRVKADAGQLEQVLVNLAVNGRDAMPAGGSLSIDTHNIDVDASYAASRPGMIPGPYVRLRVSDTGTGMDQKVAAKAFEPFFTTKPGGEGTGLGLATVYGIVTQAGGYARLYSEPGYGTTFTALFPATDQAATIRVAPAAPNHSAGGETVLVVEDEHALREVTRRILSQNQYDVLLASNGDEAIHVAEEHEGAIDLLLTDVIMPNMLGREVAQRITAVRPGTRVLYMSGYAQPMLDSTGGLDPDVTLVEKPFSAASLLAMVRRVLDAEVLDVPAAPDPGVPVALVDPAPAGS
ncbi:MAG: sensor hybrid histidine kinase [Acidimicrobiales bacterium]|nr:sensor hybrid histidine kinase [Acidimicrobiales bacterium]